ncbi:MAG: NAD(P)-binding domain-containing protein [Bacilli bacterium]|nr:NAD(P)-binding domain-containing protein [Bacilli bacterium]
MKILIIGGDKRYLTLSNKLKQQYDITHIKSEEELQKIDIKQYKIIIFPISGVSKENTVISLNNSIKLNKETFQNISPNTIIYSGIVNQNLINLVPENHIISFLADEDVKRENNILTVDGILDKIRQENVSTICILGFGNIGKLLYQKLLEENKTVIVGVKEEKDLLYLKEKAFYTTYENMTIFLNQVDYIVNTVPENIIKISQIINPNIKILDVASFPHGINIQEAKTLQNYTKYLGIPAKRSPKEAGKILYKKLKKDLKGENL